jgi:D-glycero-D-manno-heptose 1,7-bisphosphate phosphatase
MKAVIQAGGKGTRISSITGDTIPKPMLEISGYPILYHQIMNLKKSGITDITIIVGHLGNVIQDYFKDGKELGVNITYVVEDPNKPLGTAGALYYLKDKINDDFVFLLADVFIDIDFKKMEDFHYKNNADVTLLTHPNSHPFDSDLVVADKNNKVLNFDHKTNNRTYYNYHNLVNAGIMIFSNKTLDLIHDAGKYSYEKDIVVPLIEKGKVFSYKSSEYAKDMGTPERYALVQEDYNKGLPLSRNLSNKQKCIFLDRDGTINEYVGFLRKEEQMKLIPGVAQAIKDINNSDYLCIVITNQPVVARGEVTVQGLEEIHMKMEKLLGNDGAFINDLYYCPHHPDKGFAGERIEYKINCDCRKPKPGLILQAAKEYNIDLSESWMIGDGKNDVQCGINAGCKTGLIGNEIKVDINDESLLSIINKIIK